MTDEADALSAVEIAKIGQLVEALERSRFDYMTLEVSGFRLTLGKAGVTPPEAALAAPPPSGPPEAPPSGAGAPSATPPAAAEPAPESAAASDGLVDVLATTMGCFYAQPDPASPPFVEVGARVEADSPVGLIEVMKLFNSVSAGVAGTVAEIRVANEDVVEFGQVLMRIRPDA